MLVFSHFSSPDLVLFLRNWWVRRRRLNESYVLGMRTGISRSEFRRLIVTVMCILVVYLPLSIYGLYVIVRVPMRPFVWELVHGPLWKIIVFQEQNKSPWSSWIGIILAFESFLVIGMTRNAVRFFQHCVEWIYDHAPKRLQAVLPGMRKISEACKERRDAELMMTNGGRNGVNVSESYIPPRGHSNSRKRNRQTAAKNWFDSDEDELEDTKSVPSSEATLFTDPAEKGYGKTKQLEERMFARNGIITEVSSGSGAPSNWAQGVHVTRQVIVETSSR